MLHRMRQQKGLVFIIIILVLSGFHYNSIELISIPSVKDYEAQQEDHSKILAVTSETDFNCLPAGEAVIRSVEGNIRLFMNFRSRQNRFGIGTSALLFAIVFAMVLFPYLIYSVAIDLYGRCMIPLWKIIAYIHLLDGKKGDANIQI